MPCKVESDNDDRLNHADRDRAGQPPAVEPGEQRSAWLSRCWNLPCRCQHWSTRFPPIAPAEAGRQIASLLPSESAPPLIETEDSPISPGDKGEYDDDQEWCQCFSPFFEPRHLSPARVADLVALRTRARRPNQHGDQGERPRWGVPYPREREIERATKRIGPLHSEPLRGTKTVRIAGRCALQSPSQRGGRAINGGCLEINLAQVSRKSCGLKPKFGVPRLVDLH
jgi:hypothetical protein